MPQPLLLIDANSFFYRAFHAIPMLTAPDGTPVNAIHGVLSMLLTLIHEYQPSGIAVIFDAKGKNFRHELFPEYKAQRAPMPDALRAQIEPLHHLIQLMGLPLLVIPGIEADDVIATLATQASAQGQEVVIASGDKDLCQLVNDQVRIIDTMKNTLMTPSSVRDKFGVPPESIVDWLTLVGDKSDNIPGVDGVGEKTAAKLLRAHGTLSGVIQAMQGQRTRVAENILAAAPRFPLIQQLVITKRDCELPLQWQQLSKQPSQHQALLSELQRLNLKRTITLMQQYDWLNESQTPNSTLDKPLYQPSNGYCIQSVTECQQWLEQANTEQQLCFKLITLATSRFQNQLVGIALYNQQQGAAYIPIAHNTTDRNFDAQTVLTVMAPYLTDVHLSKLGHGLKEDWHMLAHHGITLAGICNDSMLQSYVINATASRHQLEDLAQYYLGHTATRLETLIGKGKQQLSFADIDVDTASRYACEQITLTHTLFQYFQQTLNTLPQLKQLYETIERPLMPVIAAMEQAGVKVDITALHQQSNLIGEDIHRLENQAHLLAGEIFNLNSSSQLAHILFDKMGLPALKKTPSGKPSTSEDVLEQLADTYELPKLILEYRSLSKLKSTYLDALPNHINPQTGRIHSHFHQTITATGRLSSSEPNLQNIPVRSEAGRRIRQAFIAEDNCLIIAADYSQIELRLMAHLSQDETLLHAFAQGKDIHTATASEVFNIPIDQVNSEQRRAAKAVNFGLIYGMSAFGLAKQLGVERAIAQHYIDTYFARYPGVAAYMTRAKTLAKNQGYVETIFNRRLYLPDIHAKNTAVRAYAERTAINAPLQGSAADLIKLAMIQVHHWLQQQTCQSRLIMQVHDELLIEAPQHEVAQVSTQLKHIMENVAQLRVPLIVDVGVGHHWDAAK